MGTAFAVDDSVIDEVLEDQEANRPATTAGQPDPDPAGDQDKQTFVNLETNTAPASDKDWSKYTDKWGRPFDPDLHRTEADGSPRINKRDGFISIKAGKGKPPGAAGPVHPSNQSPQNNPDVIDLDAQAAADQGALAVQESNLAQCTTTALMGLAMVENVMVNTLGDGWAFRQSKLEMAGHEVVIDERQMFADPLAMMMMDAGITTMPPSMALAGAAMAFLSVRMGDQETRPQVQSLFKKCKRGLVNLYLRIRAMVKR